MKPNLAVLLLLLPLTTELSAKESAQSQRPPMTTEQNGEQTPAVLLATEVKEIASSPTMSRKSQAKLITDAVHMAITAAIEGIKDPAEKLNIALELATIAAKAAPQFSATITSAVSSIPFLAKNESALEQIQDAVKAGHDAGEEPDLANPSANPPHSEKPEFGGPNGGPIVSPSH